MEAAVERLAALAFILTGLSHVAAPRAWEALFARMAENGEAAGLINAYLHLPLGLVIAAFHPVWSGPGLAVTLIGWALVAKGALHFVRPALAARSIALVAGRPGRLRASGFVALLIGLAIGWIALAAPPG